MALIAVGAGLVCGAIVVAYFIALDRYRTTAAATNGFTFNRLQDAVTQQQSLSTLYKGFVSNIEDVDMGKAITNLNQNQVALQAALQVTAQLNKVSLLTYLPPA